MGGESRCFRIVSGVRQGCFMSPWLFNVYMCAMNEVKMRMQKISAISGVGERVEIAWLLAYRYLCFVW